MPVADNASSDSELPDSAGLHSERGANDVQERKRKSVQTKNWQSKKSSSTNRHVSIFESKIFSSSRETLQHFAKYQPSMGVQGEGSPAQRQDSTDESEPDLPIASERYTVVGMESPRATERPRPTHAYSPAPSVYNVPISFDPRLQHALPSRESHEHQRSASRVDLGASGSPHASRSFSARRVDSFGTRIDTKKNICASSPSSRESSVVLELENAADDAPNSSDRYRDSSSRSFTNTLHSFGAPGKREDLGEILPDVATCFPLSTISSESESGERFLMGQAVGADAQRRARKSKQRRASVVTLKKRRSQPGSRDSSLDDGILRNASFWKPFLQHDRKGNCCNEVLLDSGTLPNTGHYSTNFADHDPLVRGMLRSIEESGFDPAGFQKRKVGSPVPPRDGDAGTCAPAITPTIEAPISLRNDHAGIFAPPTGRKYIVRFRRPILAEFVECVSPILGDRRLSDWDFGHLFDNIQHCHKDTRLGRTDKISVAQKMMGAWYGIHPQNARAIYTIYEKMCGEYHGAFRPPFDFRLKNVDNLLLVQDAFGEAARSGLQKGDVLVSVNSTTVGNMPERIAYELLSYQATHSKHPVVLHWMRVHFTVRPQENLLSHRQQMADEDPKSPRCPFVTMDPLSPKCKDAIEALRKHSPYDLRRREAEYDATAEPELQQPSSPSSPSSSEIVNFFDADTVEESNELRDGAKDERMWRNERVNEYELFGTTGSRARISPPTASQASPTRVQCKESLQSSAPAAPDFAAAQRKVEFEYGETPSSRTGSGTLSQLSAQQNNNHGNRKATAFKEEKTALSRSRSPALRKLLSHTQCMPQSEKLVRKKLRISSHIPPCDAERCVDKAREPSRCHQVGSVAPSWRIKDSSSINGALSPPHDPKEVWNSSQQTDVPSPSHSPKADCEQEQENEHVEVRLEENVASPTGRSFFERKLQKETSTNSTVAMNVYNMLTQGPHCKDKDVCVISPSLLFIVSNKEGVQSLSEKAHNGAISTSCRHVETDAVATELDNQVIAPSSSRNHALSWDTLPYNATASTPVQASHLRSPHAFDAGWSIKGAEESGTFGYGHGSPMFSPTRQTEGSCVWGATPFSSLKHEERPCQSAPEHEVATPFYAACNHATPMPACSRDAGVSPGMQHTQEQCTYGARALPPRQEIDDPYVFAHSRDARVLSSTQKENECSRFAVMYDASAPPPTQGVKEPRNFMYRCDVPAPPLKQQEEETRSFADARNVVSCPFASSVGNQSTKFSLVENQAYCSAADCSGQLARGSHGSQTTGLGYSVEPTTDNRSIQSPVPNDSAESFLAKSSVQPSEAKQSFQLAIGSHASQTTAPSYSVEPTTDNRSIQTPAAKDSTESFLAKSSAQSSSAKPSLQRARGSRVSRSSAISHPLESVAANMSAEVQSAGSSLAESSVLLSPEAEDRSVRLLRRGCASQTTAANDSVHSTIAKNSVKQSTMNDTSEPSQASSICQAFETGCFFRKHRARHDAHSSGRHRTAELHADKNPLASISEASPLCSVTASSPDTFAPECTASLVAHHQGLSPSVAHSVEPSQIDDHAQVHVTNAHSPPFSTSSSFQSPRACQDSSSLATNRSHSPSIIGHASPSTLTSSLRASPKANKPGLPPAVIGSAKYPRANYFSPSSGVYRSSRPLETNSPILRSAVSGNQRDINHLGTSSYPCSSPLPIPHLGQRTAHPLGQRADRDERFYGRVNENSAVLATTSTEQNRRARSPLASKTRRVLAETLNTTPVLMNQDLIHRAHASPAFPVPRKQPHFQKKQAEFCRSFGSIPEPRPPFRPAE